MIHIIEGKPGAGKTYFVVSWILQRYYYYDKRYFEYLPRENNPLIYTNIRDIKLSGIRDINSVVSNAGSLENFLSVDDHGQLTYPELKNAVIVIDEAQQPSWFHRKFYNPRVMYFFQTHRHHGIEVFLCTQDVKSLCLEIRELPEYHIKAVRQSLQLGSFRYRKYYDQEGGERSFLKRDPHVFEIYSSVVKGAEIVKPRSVMIRYIVIFVVLLVVLLGSFNLFRYYFFGGGNKPSSTVSTAKKQRSHTHTSELSFISEANAASDPAPSGGRAIGGEQVVKLDNKKCVVGSYQIYSSDDVLIQDQDILASCE